jgi:hypothetical protein
MASKRNYLTQAELAEFADITITDPTEADDQISQAEEMIDAYVGFQQKHLGGIIQGHATAGGSTTLTVETNHQNVWQKDYLAGCHIEIIGGTGSGKTRRRITGQTYAGVITIDSAWDTNPDSTSIYKIFQMGKFPRLKDVFYDGNAATPTYYPSIPEAVKRAVAAQVVYKIEMGDSFFNGEGSNMSSESIGDYSYSLGTGGSGSTRGASRLIAPRAKLLLRGITNRTGVIIV